MRSGEVFACMFLRRWHSFVEAGEDVLCVNESDDAVKVHVAPETFIGPEKRGEVTRVSKARGFEKYVVKAAAACYQ